MFRYVHILLLAIFCAAPVAAQDPADEQNIWAAIDANDYASADAIFANEHLRFQRGVGDPDNTRRLYGIFGTNSPEVAQFSVEWLKAYPDSPYAHIALAWVYYKTGWYIRGEGTARSIYPDALAEFSALHDMAWEHAEFAYDADHSLRPASDALLRLSYASRRKQRALEVLGEVMETDPNMGTLRRSLGMTVPGWGGSWELAENICDTYGPMIDWPESDPVTFCKLIAAGNFHRPDKEEWVRAKLATGNYPDLDGLRMVFATWHTATREEAEFARDYLSREDITSAEYARDFDMYVAPKYELDFFREAHERRAWDHAREAIKRDPYNLDLLETLEIGVSRNVRKSDGTHTILIEKPSRDERIEYARRMLVAAPYDPGHWMDYGRQLFDRTPDTFLSDDPYRVNAIVYSSHKPRHVLGYATDKWLRLDTLERLESDAEKAIKMGMDAAEVNEHITKWKSYRAQLDLDEALRCPMMRAYRLLKLLCETSNSVACDIDPQQQEMFEIVQTNVNKRRICTGVMSVSPHELFFTPIPVDLSAPEG